MRPALLPRRPLLLAGLLLAGPAAVRARADGPEGAPATARIAHHRIEARFDPASRRIVARDVVDLDVSAGRTFTFALDAGIDAVWTTFLDVAEGTGAVAPRRGAPVAGSVSFTATLPEGVHQVEVRYAGTIVGAGGDASRGGISEKGVHLGGAGGWYPTTAGDGPARFDVDAWVPAPFLVVTQGGVPERSSVTTARGGTDGDRIAPLAADAGDEPGGAWNRVVARAVVPTQGCALFAAPYVTATREVRGVAVSTWVLPGQAAKAPLWLDAAADVVTALATTPGAHPHPKLDVVEGLLPGTAGGPSYVVLDEGALRSVESVAEGAVVLRSVAGPASDPAGGPPAGAPAPTTGRAQVEERLRAAGFSKTDVPTEFPLGVADLLSKRDLILTTANGTEVLENAFRPLFNSAERELGTPLPFGTGEGVPLPGRLPDASPESLARFFRQLSMASPAALFVVPSAAARVGVAPFLDAPNALTPASEAELGKVGPDGQPRPRPDVRAWISGRRARATSAVKPLPLPVVLLEDAAYDRLDRAPAVLTVDFAVKFGPERATWAAGTGGTNVVYGFLPPGASGEKPPVVVLSAPYRGTDGGADVACVLAAVGGLPYEVRSGPAPKRGLIVCLFDGTDDGLLGSRALAPVLLERFDVTAVVNVDRLAPPWDPVHVLGLSRAPALAEKAVAVIEGSGLEARRELDASSDEEGGDHGPFHRLGVPAIGLSTRGGPGTAGAPGDRRPVDPDGSARLGPVVRKLVRRLLDE